MTVQINLLPMTKTGQARHQNMQGVPFNAARTLLPAAIPPRLTKSVANPTVAFTALVILLASLVKNPA